MQTPSVLNANANVKCCLSKEHAENKRIKTIILQVTNVVEKEVENKHARIHTKVSHKFIQTMKVRS